MAMGRGGQLTRSLVALEMLRPSKAPTTDGALIVSAIRLAKASEPVVCHEVLGVSGHMAV